MLEFLQYIIRFFNQHQIPYMLSGSVALSVYTLPRATRDFDFIVHLQSKDVSMLAENFKEGFYCDKDAIEEAVKRQSMFNIIDHTSGFKADFVILKNNTFRQTEFNRRKQIDFFGLPIWIVSAEDLLISKLIWIQDFQGNLQMEDIKNLSKVNDLDWQYIRRWLHSLNLNTFGLIDE